MALLRTSARRLRAPTIACVCLACLSVAAAAAAEQGDSAGPTPSSAQMSTSDDAAPQTDQDFVFDMGKIVVVGTPDGQPVVGGAVLSSEQIWTFDRKPLDQAVNIVAGEQLQWLGGVNVAGTRATAPKRPFTIEEIKALAPHVIVLTGSAVRLRSDCVRIKRGRASRRFPRDAFTSGRACHIAGEGARLR